MPPLRASCSCGQLGLEYEGEIQRTSICHCLACQARTGSVFGVQTRLERGKVKTHGKSTEYVRTPDDGGWVKFHFCPTCGATVFWEIDDMPEFLVAPLGAFGGDPRLPAPTFSVYEARKHAWVTLPESVVEHWD